jgi:APA family basic amino acid/polyamine antiporter
MSDASQNPEPELARVIGLKLAIAIGAGGVIGAPIFTILGYASGMAGPAVVLAFLLGGVVAILIGISYSELSSTFPASGGGYTFAKKAFGGMPAFLTGWLVLFANIIFGSLSALGFAKIIGAALNLPDLTQIAIGLAILAAFAYLNTKSLKESGQAQLVLIVVLVAGFLVLIAGSAFAVSPSHLTPFMPSGWFGVFEAVSFTFVSYFGFQTIATVSGEVKEPGRVITIATIVSLVICILLYCAISWITIGVAGMEALGKTGSPLTLAGGISLGVPGIVLAAALGAIATFTSLNAALISSSRIVFALSTDGLLPSGLGRTSRQGTPILAVVAVAFLMGLFVSTGGLEFITYVADFALLLGLILVSASLVVLRRKRAILERPFKAPLIIPIVSIPILAILMVFLNNLALSVGILVTFFGMVIYLFRIAPARNRILAIGGAGIGGALVLATCLWLARWTLPLHLGLIPIEIVPVLVFACVVQVCLAFICVFRIRAVIKWLAPRESTSPRMANALKWVQGGLGVLGVACSIIAVIVFYFVLYGVVSFPGAAGFAEGYEFLLILGLGGFAFSAMITGLFVLQGRYAL